MSNSPNIEKLIEQLRILPGVGPKTAQRMAFHVLAQHRRSKAKHLAQTLEMAVQTVRHCDSCRNYCESTLCHICASPDRDPSTLCIIESPQDVWAIEQTASFKGHYFVLHGRLSPLDGIGPQDIGLDQLIKRMSTTSVQELIIATNSTVEGEATAHYIAQQAQPLNIPCSRIAHGVPMGGELEYLDGNTLSYALQARVQLDTDHVDQR
ncbi:MAG: recombination protein RecR [Legionellales bacterium]|nr:recombination protein RecR [Legionellales bacterium]